MPGAPLTSTREPRTAPPPSTRSSSPSPVVKRSSSLLWISSSRLGAGARMLLRTAAFGENAAGGVYSCKVFHIPQAGQRPCHLGVSFPQLEQRKTVLDFILCLQIVDHTTADRRSELLLIPGLAQECLLAGVGKEPTFY